MADPNPDLIAQLGLKMSTIVAGLGGSLLALVRARKSTPQEAFLAFTSGFMCSLFLTPAISEYFSFSAKVEGAIGFVLGIVGMTAITFIVDMAEKFRADPLGVITFLRKQRTP